MAPPLTIDLREHDFETMHELVGIVSDLVLPIQNSYPKLTICALVITEHHLKMLRLEQYMQGMPLQEVKRTGPQSVCGLPVIIDLGDGKALCPGCGGLHDLDVVWYHER